MKTLVVSARPPLFPGRDFNGGAQRFSMFLRAIAKLSTEITLVHFIPERLLTQVPDSQALSRNQSEKLGRAVTVDLVPIGAAPRTRWSYYGAGILSVHGHPQWQPVSASKPVEAVRRHFDSYPDLVFGHRLGGMCPIMRGGFQHPRLFFDLDDIEHRVHFRTTLQPPHWAGKLFYIAQVPAIMLGERKAASMAQATFVCSDLDRLYLAKCGVARKATVIPNAVRFPPQVPRLVSDQTIVFLGGYTFLPNAYAAERLICRIWPLVRRHRPNARLLIAGSAPELLPSFRHRPEGVEYLGFVPDLDALYRRSRLVCCPIQIGGGTRFKLIEAAGFGKPVISTRIGAEGLDLRAGTDILIADTDEQLAEACLTLLREDRLCEQLGQSARERVLTLYDVQAVERRLLDALTKILD